jgi:colicin import membrane protein
MRQFGSQVALFVALISCTTTVQALTPLQTATATKAKADALTRITTQTQTKAKADAAARARIDALAKAKAHTTSVLNVRAETQRRIEAATKAAAANAQVTSFRPPSTNDSIRNGSPKLNAAAAGKTHVPDAANTKAGSMISRHHAASNEHVATGSSHRH